MKVLMLAAMLALSSCALITPGSGKFRGEAGVDTFRVEIESVSEADYSKFRTYKIVPSKEIAQGGSSIIFRRYSGYLKKVLSKQGLVESDGDVDLTIVMSYYVNVDTFRITVNDAYYLGGRSTQRKTYLHQVLLKGLNNKNQEIFSSTLRSKNKIGDLKTVVPFLIEAGAVYIGKDLKGIKKVKIKNDERKLENVI